jgi:hypothetical protein
VVHNVSVPVGHRTPGTNGLRERRPRDGSTPPRIKRSPERMNEHGDDALISDMVNSLSTFSGAWPDGADKPFRADHRVPRGRGRTGGANQAALDGRVAWYGRPRFAATMVRGGHGSRRSLARLDIRWRPLRCERPGQQDVDRHRFTLGSLLRMDHRRRLRNPDPISAIRHAI